LEVGSLFFFLSSLSPEPIIFSSKKRCSGDERKEKTSDQLPKDQDGPQATFSSRVFVSYLLLNVAWEPGVWSGSFLLFLVVFLFFVEEKTEITDQT